MPFVNVKTNISVSKVAEESVKSSIGELIAIFPGKSEDWLMVNIEDNSKLYFRGDNSNPIAFVEVKIFGSANAKACNTFTCEITNALNNILGISGDQIYVKYEFVDTWGYAGNNF